MELLKPTSRYASEWMSVNWQFNRINSITTRSGQTAPLFTPSKAAITLRRWGTQTPEPQGEILPGHEICRSKTTQCTDRQDELPPYLGIRSEPFLKEFRFSMNVNLIDNIFHTLPFYNTKWSLLSPWAATVLIPIEASRTQAIIKYVYLWINTNVHLIVTFFHTSPVMTRKVRSTLASCNCAHLKQVEHRQ